MLNEAPAWCTCGGPPSKRGAVSRSAVVALGGNALTAEGQRGTHREQRENATAMARSIAALLDDGWRLAIVHGNGPQIGALSIQQEEGRRRVPEQPLFSLGAMTEGQLGSLVVLAMQASTRRAPVRGRGPHPHRRRPGRPCLRPADQADRPVLHRGRRACPGRRARVARRRGRRARLPADGGVAGPAGLRRDRRRALPAGRRARRRGRRRGRHPGRPRATAPGRGSRRSSTRTTPPRRWPRPCTRTRSCSSPPWTR